VAQGLVVAAALALLAASAAASLGWIGWPELPVVWNGAPVPQAGMIAQLGMTALFLALCLFLPANTRMARLERSHRSFHVGLDDVLRAYDLAHAADRRGAFALSGEFDAVRARMDHLRKHPDLAELEPEILELAAQMGYAARELARAYSDEKVARAKGFLRQRQEEAERMADRLRIARQTCDELRRWLTDVEAEERRNSASLRRLEADLREILPGLGYEVDDWREPNVVPLPQKHPG
jgi:AraC-like DNA-binding protein